ncbi:MAG: glycosyltransferase [Anaerolineaceae bacterium]|nr:glycosyltransferase [Anaerolineaceae bacterium]MDE0327652.1 glycosyltransferase [Anaerolineaceae bacterium]
MRILFIDSLTHVKEYWQALADTAPGEEPPLFPTSMKEHFYVRALRRRGHEPDVFWREQPSRNYRFHAGLTPGKAAAALMQRLPPSLNPVLQRRNQELIQKAREFKPDLLWLCSGNRTILPQTLATIRREQGCRLLVEYGESHVIFRFPFMLQLLPLVDLVIVNDLYHGMQMRELGARRVVTLPVPAMDPDFHYPRPLDDGQRAALACDVAFVGTLLPEHIYGERVRMLVALRDFNPGIWSVHDAPPELRPFLRGAALGESMLEILSAAKLAVNPHGQTMQYGGNPRLFEAAGVGTLQITDDRPGIHKWFTPGENILTFRDEADLRDKVAWFLAHDDEREEMARRAREHVLAHHRFDHRVERIEALLATL